MPHIRLIPTQSYIRNTQQIRDFYSDVPEVGKRAIKAIKDGLRLIASHPEAWQPNPEDDGVTRIFPVRFGDSGYAVKYLYIKDTGEVVLLGIRSFSQAGYY